MELVAYLITWGNGDQETRFNRTEAVNLASDLTENGWLNVEVYPLFRQPRTGLCLVHDAQDCHYGCPYREKNRAS